MPSGAKKRKAAKKKKVHDSSTPHSHHGENDGGELSSPASNQDPATGAPAEVVKREDSSSENKSVTIEKDFNEEEGSIEIEIGSKSKKSNDSSSSSSSSSSDDESQIVEKNVVVLESAPVESVQAIESFPENITQKVEELEVSAIGEPVELVESPLEEVSAIAEPVKLVDSPLEEGLQKYEEKQTVFGDEIASIDDCSSSSVVIESGLKENGVAELPLSDEKVFLELKDQAASSTSPKGSISVNETETIEYSERQPLVASTPLAVQKTTSWKGCCGILELFSGSDR